MKLPPLPPEDEPTTDPGLHAAFRRHDNKLTLRSFLIAATSVATGVAAVLLFLDSRVAAATDAGVKVHELRLIAVEQQVPALRQELNTRLERLEAGQARSDVKLDAVLQRFSVPNPAPAPKDGGQ